MKLNFTTLGRIACVIALLSITACRGNVGKGVLIKNTTFGLDVSQGQPGSPAFRLGLSRQLYAAIPTNATLDSRVIGRVGAIKQDVDETIRFGVQANSLAVPSQPTNPPASIAVNPLATNAVSK